VSIHRQIPVVLKAARWWYIHGRAGRTPRSSGPSNGRHLATDVPSDAEQFDDFLEYLGTVGFADEEQAFR